ncbi:hypothetical protein IID24_03210 [Patescibacteria group bacterium]|nr:hypothetical protein [Patescibacteria group bacterium]
MEFVIGGRQSGKTTKAIKWLKQDDRRKLAVSHETEKQRLMVQYKLPADRFIVWDKSKQKDFGLDCELGVDNAEWLIQEFFRNRVVKVWVTGRKK